MPSTSVGDRSPIAPDDEAGPSFQTPPSQSWDDKGLDLGELIRPLLEALAKLADLESTYLTVFDWDRREQEVRFVFSTGESQIDEGHRVPVPPELSPEAFPGVTRSFHAITSTQPDSWVAKQLGLKAYVSVPVTVANHRLFGMLCGASRQPQEISETVVSMFVSLAAIMAEHVVRLHLEAIEARALAAESQLHQERLLLEVFLADAERVKNELTAVGNHELRTPITTISGSAQLLQSAGERLTTEERADLLTGIVQQTQKIQNIVENLAFEDEIPPADRDASTDVRSDAVAILGWLERAGVNPSRFRLEVPPGTFVQIDRDILRSVLFNLFDNASKFSPPDSPVMVNAERVGACFRISIANGGHIEREDRLRIFDRFEQIDASDTRSFGGLGLGLHVVRRELEAYGGTIQVENTEQSVIFTVVLTAAPDFPATESDWRMRSSHQGGPAH